MMLHQNSLELALVQVQLQDLRYLDRVSRHMLDLLKIDVSQNLLDSIDWLNQFKQLKVIIAHRCLIRSVNLHLPRLQELDVKNNFIERMPAFRTMPNLQSIFLKANNIEQINLEFSAQNYANMVNIDMRNNKKLQMDDVEIERLAKKLANFKKLRFFNIEHENLRLERNLDLYYQLIMRLPDSLEMFNNKRTIYLLDEVKQRGQLENLNSFQRTNGERIESIDAK